MKNQVRSMHACALFAAMQPRMLDPMVSNRFRAARLTRTPAPMTALFLLLATVTCAQRLDAAALAVDHPTYKPAHNKGAQPLLDSAHKKEIAMEIDALMRNRFPDDRAPGACVLVAQNGQVLFAKGYGIADLATSTPITTNTHFRLASVTKQFTAMAVLILCDEGKLKYTDRLTDIFPDFPPYGSSITIEELLHHTSGLKAYEDLIPPEQTEQVHDQDVLEMMKKQTGTYFPPGSQYRYSNTGYAVLAMVVQRVSGMRFADFLKRRIFEPAGMKETVAYEKGISEVPDRAMGTKKVNGHFKDADQSVTSAVLGDGGIYCSPEEYLKWDQALYSGRLVSPARLKDAFTPGVLTDGKSTDYGFGWRIGENKGYKVVHHTGTTTGFNNCVRRIPELRLLVVVLCNRSGSQAKELAPEIENLVLAQMPEKK